MAVCFVDEVEPPRQRRLRREIVVREVGQHYAVKLYRQRVGPPNQIPQYL